MRYLPGRRSAKTLVQILAGMLFALSLLPSMASAQTKPLQVGDLPVT